MVSIHTKINGLINANKTLISGSVFVTKIFIFLYFFFLFFSWFIDSDPKVLTQERPQPILKLHVAGRLRPGVFGHHFAERFAIRPGISAGPVVIVVPVPEHL